MLFSVLTSLCISSFFIGQVSLPYTSTLCTHTLYIFPFTLNEAPLTVNNLTVTCRLLVTRTLRILQILKLHLQPLVLTQRQAMVHPEASCLHQAERPESLIF